MAFEQNRSLIPALQTILRDLRATPYPPLDSPESTKRRASVAFILRIKPTYANWPPVDSRKADDLGSYFSEEWVQYGDPEVLFIKRAARKGDRWTSHIALPGGRRDPEDEDDQASAIRETWEEVGIDLKKYAIECGNLPQRLVTTHWGKKPLMVLCPYVFLMTSHEFPPLKLQPTEVASTHWVPLRSLIDPAQRTVAFEDVSSRLANEETGVRKWMASLMLGRMMFAAINLVPTETLHSAETPVQDTLQDNRHVPIITIGSLRAFAGRIWRSDIFNEFPTPRRAGPLLLWGLTLGVVSDFLDLIPPHNALTLWTYPTFTPLDVRFTVWLMTYRFKDRKRAELQSGSAFRDSRPSFGGAAESMVHHSEPGTLDISSSTVMVERPDETGFHGLGTGSGAGDVKNKKAAVHTMLEGFVEPLARLLLPEITDRGRYYDIVRRAVAVALVGRVSLGTVMAVVIWGRYFRRPWYWRRPDPAIF